MLPDRLDSSAASALRTDLLGRRGRALILDASGVEMMGALSLEVIIAAGRQWDADGHDLQVQAGSGRYVVCCQVLGIDPLTPWQAMDASAPDSRVTA